jgi:hypothetical protein
MGAKELEVDDCDCVRNIGSEAGGDNATVVEMVDPGRKDEEGEIEEEETEIEG